jgi:hypothetical protein
MRFFPPGGAVEPFGRNRIQRDSTGPCPDRFHGPIVEKARAVI